MKYNITTMQVTKGRSRGMFLEIKGIKKSFGTGDSRVNVLKGLDLEIERGEILCASGTIRFRKIDSSEYYRRH